MAWTARLVRKELQETFRDFIVDFTDGIETVREQFRVEFGVSTDGVKRRVFARLEQFNSSVTADIPDGEVDFTVPGPPPPPPPTIEEAEFLAWITKYGKLQTVEDLVKFGVIPDTNPKVQQLRTEVQTEFKVAFLARMGVS